MAIWNHILKFLDVCMVENADIRLWALCDMLPDHTAKVVECFFKLTKWIKKDNMYVPTEEPKTILKAGLKSSDENVRHNAKLAHKTYLKRAGLIVEFERLILPAI